MREEAKTMAATVRDVMTERVVHVVRTPATRSAGVTGLAARPLLPPTRLPGVAPPAATTS